MPKTKHELPVMWSVAAFLEFVIVGKPVIRLFGGADSQVPAVWLQKLIMNLPMAFCWKIFAAGPLVRNLFGPFLKIDKGGTAVPSVPEKPE